MKVSLLNINILKIEFRYNVLTKNLIKELDGRKWEPKGKFWTIPVNLKVLASLDILKKAGFVILDEVWTVLGDLSSRERELNDLGQASDANFTTELPLLPYQRAGSQFLLKAGSAVLGDDVGLGKTIQTLATIEARGDEVKKVLVFCPAVLKYQWQNEIIKFLGSNFSDGSRRHQFTQVIDGNGAVRAKQWADRWPYKYYIANYELLLRDFEFMDLIKWDYIICDEATKISNPKAKTSKAIKNLRSKFKLALTGTLISNKPDDAWNIIDFIVPGALGTFDKFLDKYTLRGPFKQVFSYHNLDELAAELKRYVIRRKQSDVLSELPEQRVIDVPFKLNEVEKELYNKIRMTLLFEIEQMDINKVENPTTIQMTLVKMLRLRQCADSLELLGEKTESSKLQVLKELLTELAMGHKIVIFSEFSEMCKILKRELSQYNPVMITGDIPNKDRQTLLDKFNTDPHCNICILSSAGMYGLNIYGANVVIHFDQVWSLGKLIQRNGRISGLRQTQREDKNVLIYNLLAKGTVDDYMQKKLFSKKEMADKVLGMAEIREMLAYDEN